MLCHILDKGTCRDERGLCPETEWARLCSLGRDGRKDGEWRKGIGRGSGRVYKRKCGGGFWIERARPGMEDITEGALRSVEKTAREKIARKSRTAWDMEERGTGSRGRRETMMMVAVNPSRGRPDRKRFGRMFPTSLFPHHFLWMDVLSSFRYKYIRASPGIDSTDWRTFVPVGCHPSPLPAFACARKVCASRPRHRPALATRGRQSHDTANGNEPQARPRRPTLQIGWQ